MAMVQQMRTVIEHVTGRWSRNICFWLLFPFLYVPSHGSFIIHYVAVTSVLFIAYGIPAYVNNLWLIPHFLLSRRKAAYVGTFALLVGVTTIMSYYSTRWVNDAVKDLNYMNNFKDVAVPYHLFPSLLMLSLLMFGKFIADAIHNQNRLAEMEKQKLTSELDSLRSQINPHFLFNALNTVYGMVRRTDMQAAEVIIQLSDILRHSIYECEENEISLETEINFIRQYVDFARLRVHNKDSVLFSIGQTQPGQKIAPLLLIPFIENAIKHGIEKNAGDAAVAVGIAMEGSRLQFSCVNTTMQQAENGHTARGGSGIGLKNVKRRLELIYPGRHQIEIRQTPGSYAVNLNIDLA